MVLYDSNVVKFVEWIEESVFKTFPTNPAMKGFGGRITNVSFKGGATYDNYSYLVAPSTADPLGASDSIKTGQEMEIEVTFKPTDWTILPVVLSSDSLATYAVGDTKNYISVGLVAAAEYAKAAGGVVTSVTGTITGGKLAEMKVTIKCAAFTDWSGTDYKGTGSHSTVPSSPLSVVTSVLYDAAALSSAKLILDTFTFTIEQPADAIVDPSDTTDSHIADWDFGPRQMSVELGVSATGMDIDDDLWDGSAHTFAFTGLSKTLTFGNIKWQSTDRPLSAADKLGLTLKSEPVCTLTIT